MERKKDEQSTNAEMLRKRMENLINGIKFIDLKIDYSFKRVFGTEGNEDLLLMLINSILPEKNICSVRLGSQERTGDNSMQHKAIFDIYCTTSDGESLIIEMQYRSRDDMADRMLYYSGFPIRDSLKPGVDDFRGNPVYIIEILNYLLPNEFQTPDAINHYSIRNDIHTQIQFTGRLNFVSVELPKFNKQLPELSTLTEKIMYCLRYQDTFTSVPEELSCQELDKMFKISNFAAMDYNEQTEYLQEFLAEIDARSAMRYAKEQAQKEGRAEGIAEGIAEGLAEGRAEGRAKGLAEGRAEGHAEGLAEGRAMVAASMKAEGLSTAIIAKCTGLSIEEIEKL